MTGTDYYKNSSGVEYKIIPDFPGYKVGIDGSVWSDRRRTVAVKWKKLKLTKNRSGHLLVDLCKDNKAHHFRVHRLVLELFVGPCPKGMQCRHLDGNPENNDLNNLCWGTQSENCDDRRRHGWQYPKQKIKSSKANRKGDSRMFTGILANLGGNPRMACHNDK